MRLTVAKWSLCIEVSFVLQETRYTPVTRRHARGSRSTFISHMNDASTKFGNLSDARRGDCLWERQPSPRTKVTLRLTCWACWYCTRHHLLSCIRFMTLRMGSSWWREVTANSSSCFHGTNIKAWKGGRAPSDRSFPLEVDAISVAMRQWTVCVGRTGMFSRTRRDPRPPDLSTWDYLSWVYLKSGGYSQEPRTMDELKERMEAPRDKKWLQSLMWWWPVRWPFDKNFGKLHSGGLTPPTWSYLYNIFSEEQPSTVHLKNLRFPSVVL